MRFADRSSPAVKILAVSMAFTAIIVTVPGNSEAGTFPKLIYGYVWDGAGTPLEGADVTVNIRRPDTSIRATLTSATQLNGDYMVTFAPADWEIGDTIEAISTYQGHQESNSTGPITMEEPQWVNISYAFEIPEFGSAAGFLFTGALLGAVAVVMIVYFRKR
ncbi:MAG: hypothetical protein JSV90_07715 [Methanobacteriota archaeon]|nr:MAG: hypothetical protein JSV90_07715 [Euryarchaeota archaeon]